jgi:hypothetical protein
MITERRKDWRTCRRQRDRQTDSQRDRQQDRKTNRQNGQKYRQYWVEAKLKAGRGPCRKKADWLADRLTNRQRAWHDNREIGWNTCRQARPTNEPVGRQTDRLLDLQANRPIGKKADRFTERLTELTDRLTCDRWKDWKVGGQTN